MLLFAVVRGIEVLGEAAGKETDETRTRASSIPWTSIVRMRNRLIHGYFDIDTEIIWKTVAEEIPSVRKELRTIIDMW